MKRQIKVNAISDATKIVQMATNVNGDVIITKGKYSIDAKSIMGIFSIDLSQGAVIEYPDDAVELDEFISTLS